MQRRDHWQALLPMIENWMIFSHGTGQRRTNLSSQPDRGPHLMDTNILRQRCLNFSFVQRTRRSNPCNSTGTSAEPTPAARWISRQKNWSALGSVDRQ